MANLGGFNAQEVEPATGFDPLPPGKYTVMITASDMVPTKAGDGEYLKLEFKVIDGDYVNRKIWTNLNLVNPNPKAVEIAQRELSAICRACDVLTPEDSQELHGIPMEASVRIRKGTQGYPDSNTISGFKPVSETAETGSAEPAPWT